MKCEMMNGVLTFALGALVVLAVVFTLRTINLSREANRLQVQAVRINQFSLRLQALANETAAFNQKYPSPDLTRILQGH
ncbi:MAG: hypothetical protein ACLQSR_02825 [Limisphaerales bacterium]